MIVLLVLLEHVARVITGRRGVLSWERRHALELVHLGELAIAADRIGLLLVARVALVVHVLSLLIALEPRRLRLLRVHATVLTVLRPGHIAGVLVRAVLVLVARGYLVAPVTAP